MPLLHTSRQMSGAMCTADRPKQDVLMSMPTLETSPFFSSRVSPGRIEPHVVDQARGHAAHAHLLE